MSNEIKKDEDKFTMVGKPISVAELFELLKCGTVEEAFVKANESKPEK